MATFKFFMDQASPGLYEPPGRAPFTRTVDMPTIIAAGEKGGLANTSDVRQAAPLTGLAVADVLQIFQVSMGFMLRNVGFYVVAANTLANKLEIGTISGTQTDLGADADGYLAEQLTNTKGAVHKTLIADALLGGSTYEGVVFITNGSIDVTVKDQVWLEGIIAFWAMGQMCF